MATMCLPFLKFIERVLNLQNSRHSPYTLPTTIVHNEAISNIIWPPLPPQIIEMASTYPPHEDVLFWCIKIKWNRHMQSVNLYSWCKDEYDSWRCNVTILITEGKMITDNRFFQCHSISFFFYDLFIQVVLLIYWCE